MAHYIQDYLYSEVPADLIVDCLEISTFKKLPTPSSEYENILAIVNEGTSAKPTNKYYFCIQKDGVYDWVPVFDPDTLELLKKIPELPKDDGKYLLKVEKGKYSYELYKAPDMPKPYDGPEFPDSEGEYKLVVGADGKPKFVKVEDPEPPTPPTPVSGNVLLSCIDDYAGIHGGISVCRQHPDSEGNKPPYDDHIFLTFIGSKDINKVVFKFELDPAYLEIAYNPAEGIEPEINGNYEISYDKDGNLIATYMGLELPIDNHLNVALPVKVLYEGSLSEPVYTYASIIVEEAITKDGEAFKLPDNYTADVMIYEETS